MDGRSELLLQIAYTGDVQQAHWSVEGRVRTRARGLLSSCERMLRGVERMVRRLLIRRWAAIVLRVRRARSLTGVVECATRGRREHGMIA